MRTKKAGKPESPEDRKLLRSLKSEDENSTAPPVGGPHSEMPTLQTANLKLQTETMEVHHHPEVEKKGFKEYILEGLMIFLAVTMGFFAESIREHITEKSKERDYMRSMVSDLRKDSANFSQAIKLNDIGLSGLDSLIMLLNSPKRDQYGSELYYLARASILRISLYQPADRVYEEMKSSGNLRLIDNKTISDSITIYYDEVADWKEQNQLVTELILSYFNSAAKVFNAAVFQKMLTDPRFKFPEPLRPPGNPALASTSKQDITELTGKAHFLYARVNSKTKGTVKLLLRKTTDLLKLLKKEYKLENEK